MSDDWTRTSAAELGRGIEYGEINPIDLTEAYLDAMRASAYRDLIFTERTEARARAEAAAAAERVKTGTRRGLLDGVPISWKDLFDTAGIVTEAGSALLKGRVPEADALVLANATDAGLVCLGKTHMTELAFSGLGLNPITATPPNALAHERAPGGSSSGAAVSVAMGLSAAGIGSDTGGSVRIPAAWNNLVGLKTTSGLLSLAGVVPLCAKFDTVGPLCRSVEDAALLLAAMGNSKPADLSNASLNGQTFLVSETVALDDCDVDILRAFEAAIVALETAGATVKGAQIDGIEAAMDLSACLFPVEAYATWGEVIEAQPGTMYPPVEARFRSGLDYSGVAYARGWQELEEHRKTFAAAVAGYDAVLAPTVPIKPPSTEALLADEELFRTSNLMALRNTRIGNLMGLSSLTLPLPVPHAGLMLFGAPFAEEKLLRIGAAAEAVLRT